MTPGSCYRAALSLRRTAPPTSPPSTVRQAWPPGTAGRLQRPYPNRARARARVARAHRKARASRADFLHRASTRLVRGHDVIVLEDLAVKNMARNRSLAKAISDCGWGAFRRQVEYKAAR